MKNFKNWLSEHRSETSDFPPPEYVIEPAKNDKGFAVIKKVFSKRKKKFHLGWFAENKK